MNTPSETLSPSECQKTFPSAEEINYYRLYRELIVNEDTLISHRMSWFLATQTMLFILWTSLSKPVPPLLAAGICIFGILFCIPTLFGVWSAQMAVKDLFRRYNENLPVKHHPGLPDMTGKLHYQYIGKSTPYLLSLICIFGWTLVLKVWS